MQYLATPIGLYAASAVRVAMGLVLILSSPNSRGPDLARVGDRDVPARNGG